MSSGDPKITAAVRQGVDGGELSSAIGIDGEEIAWRKSFTGFDAADEARLESMLPSFETVADDLVEEFYDHLQAHSETVAILNKSDKPVEALKRDQRQYLKDLGRGTYGTDYFARRARIGKLHDLLGLGPKIYLGAYAVYYRGLFDAVASDVKAEYARGSGPATDGGVDEAPTHAGGPADRPDGPVSPETAPQAGEVEAAVDATVERLLSVVKLMNLDQQVAMDTYIHSYAEQMQAEMDQREHLTREVESDVLEPVEELQNAAEGVSTSAQEISGVAERQRESMENVAGEVSNMSATIEEIASTADEVNGRSAQAAETADEGRESAETAREVMGDIDEAATEMADDFSSLQERIAEVDEVVEVINRIAEQTNLLALNASIEAARAGDAGQGFAVVADEVKSLAEESQRQAGQIEQLVEDIRADATETVASLDETEEQVDHGIERVEDAMASLDDIAEAVEETSRGIREVADATEEQAASTEEVASLVEDAVEGATAVSTEVDDIAAATEEQTAMLDEVTRVVARLTEE
ncbi:globin-coupled sensor protein [Salinirubellus salinus]|jgi:heme-based aerotactic transducer|uniref:Globin-coupled sensor protein n=1 Tax=Salinirubellus salinus TaxID=1364945 RepID=A0A9E7R464_9EURY|nr:globin-coupled sensor protein [Salinirubellus salinus]UWM54909.1 globin-coupled sensor protein [Salinirubellus salinus]